ncbi:hypothetical protein [Streptomyces sp. NPDC006140]|uniref:hypothetical protein n=1 Tax=Streptomyces sp. NPDC006140 TaxID=3154579 RepID=UPI0033FCBC25
MGDGRTGHPEGAPYDRLIATYGLRSIPPAWLEQVRPGGNILTTLRGWTRSLGLVKLVVTGGSASGWLSADAPSFMIARQQSRSQCQTPVGPPGRSTLPLGRGRVGGGRLGGVRLAEQGRVRSHGRPRHPDGLAGKPRWSAVVSAFRIFGALRRITSKGPTANGGALRHRAR